MNERDKQITALHCEGKSQRQIARVVGISQPAVRKHLLKLGLITQAPKQPGDNHGLPDNHPTADNPAATSCGANDNPLVQAQGQGDNQGQRSLTSPDSLIPPNLHEEAENLELREEIKALIRAHGAKGISPLDLMRVAPCSPLALGGHLKALLEAEVITYRSGQRKPNDLGKTGRL